MGFLTNEIQFTGRVGQLTAYRVKGSDKIIIRKAGGPSRRTVLKDDKFERTRENAGEFARCAFASSGIRASLCHVRHLADYNFTPVLTSLCKQVQLLDDVSKRGKREVLLSRHPYFFDGFPLNRKYSFDSIVRIPITSTIDKAARTASVQFPAVLPGVTLQLPWRVPQYRIIVSLGTVPDQEYVVLTSKTRVRNIKVKNDFPVVQAASDWISSNQPFEGMQWTLPFDPSYKDGYACLLAIGLEAEIPQLKGWGGTQKIGAAKILVMK